MQRLCIVLACICSNNFVGKAVELSNPIQNALTNLYDWECKDIFNQALYKVFKQEKIIRLYGSDIYSEMRWYVHADTNQSLIIILLHDQKRARADKKEIMILDLFWHQCINSKNSVHALCRGTGSELYDVWYEPNKDSAFVQWQQIIDQHYHSLYVPETEYAHQYVMTLDNNQQVAHVKKIKQFVVKTTIDLDHNIAYRFIGSQIDLDRQIHYIIQQGQPAIVYYKDYKIMIDMQRSNELQNSDQSCSYEVSLLSDDQYVRIVRGELIV